MMFNIKDINMNLLQMVKRERIFLQNFCKVEFIDLKTL